MLDSHPCLSAPYHYSPSHPLSLLLFHVYESGPIGLPYKAPVTIHTHTSQELPSSILHSLYLVWRWLPYTVYGRVCTLRLSISSTYSRSAASDTSCMSSSANVSVSRRSPHWKRTVFGLPEGTAPSSALLTARVGVFSMAHEGERREPSAKSSSDFIDVLRVRFASRTSRSGSSSAGIYGGLFA